jgi:hypothetical protein
LNGRFLICVKKKLYGSRPAYFVNPVHAETNHAKSHGNPIRPDILFHIHLISQFQRAQKKPLQSSAAPAVSMF